MVLTRIDSEAATERATLQRASGGASFVSKEGLVGDPGIVEGWRGDEDEDVNIDSDENDSGSEGLPGPGGAENLQVLCAPAGGSSSQLPNSSGMRGRTESLASVARDEDPAATLSQACERAATLSQAASSNVAMEDENGCDVRSRKEQAERFDSGRASRGVRGGLSFGSSALEGAAKRLDARRFRRDFNVRTETPPARIKTPLPDAGRMRGSIRSDEKEGKKLAKEKEPAGGMAKKISSTQAHMSTTVKNGTGIVAGANYGKGKRTSREEISKPGQDVLQGNMKVRIVSSGERFNKDNSKKRRFDDRDYAQAVARKSSLRVRGDSSKESEDRIRRETSGYEAAGSSAKSKRARKDEELHQEGTSVSQKETPPKRGLEKVGKSPVLSSPKAGRQNEAVVNRNQRPPHANGYVRKPSAAEGENPLDRLSGDGTKKSDSGAATEAFELEKVFERRSTKRKDKGKIRAGQSDSSLHSSEVSGVAPMTSFEKTGEEESGKPVDRRPTRSTDRAYGAGKAQQPVGGSSEPKKNISKQEEEVAGLNLQRRPATKSGEKGTEGADRSPSVLETKGTSVKDLVDCTEFRKMIGDEVEKMMNGKRKQSPEADMENNGRSPQSRGIGQRANSEVNESTEGGLFDVDQQAKAKKQTLSDGNGESTPSLQGNSTRSTSLRRPENIWHPKTPLSQSIKLIGPGLGATQCVAISGSTADVDPKIATASVEVPPKEAFPRQVHGGNDTGLEEGEIGSSDYDGKQVAPKPAEPVLLRKAEGEKRLSSCDNDPIPEGRKSVTVPTVQHNEPSSSNTELPIGQSSAGLETIDSTGSIPPAKGVRYGKCRTSDTSEVEGLAGPYASTVAGEEKSEPVAVAGGDEPQKTEPPRGAARLENDCNERHSIQAAIRIDELCGPDDSPTISHKSIGRDQGDELQSPSELQAADDLIGEDRSDSEDNDYYNSYCESCRQGGELICCDGSGCKITYHLECTDLGVVPAGNWYCPTCAHKRLSYGVHAVSKSVESIWDVRNRGESSDHPSSLHKNVPASDLHCSNVKEPETKERSLDGAGRFPLKNLDRVEDDCIAAVTVSVDDEEGIPVVAKATGFSHGGTRTSDEDFHVQRLTKRRQWDGNVKILGKSRRTEGKTILGSTSSAAQALKLVDDSGDKEYFVKWRGISHAHNSWVGESELVKLSPKGLARFKKKLAEGQVVKWNPDWAEPQRLVDKRTSIPPRRPGGGRGRGFLGMDAQQEWFVKWKGLGYEHCTWEPANSGVLSDPKFKHLETMFERWSEAAKERNHPKRVEEVDKLREASFRQLQSQPEWIRFGKLFPCQLDRLNRLRQRWHHHQNTIIMDQDDQEKSSTTVTFLLSLIEEYGVYRLILVVVPVFEIQCWEAEFSEYAPQVNTVVYVGGKDARGVIQRFELNKSDTPMKVQVVLTTCEVAFSWHQRLKHNHECMDVYGHAITSVHCGQQLVDSARMLDFDYLRKIKWEVVVVDDSQQSKTTKSHRAFLQFDAAFWLLFISELSKYNVEELQQILFLFHPQSSSSTSDVRKQLTGLNESGQLQYLKDQLSEHIVKDIRPDDASGLKLVECWVGTNMTSLQIQLYCTTLTKHYNLLQSGRLRTDPDSPSLHDFMTQLRLCCQHPYLVDPTLQGCGKEDLPPSEALIDAGVEASEKWQLIHAMLSVLHPQHHRVVIISQSLIQLFFFDDYLKHKYGEDSYELVDVRHSAPRKNSAVQRFNAKDSTRSFFLLRTGASGFSLKLKDKDVVIIHDSDLNPANDLEYLRRALHRVDGELKVFRLYQRFTVEEGSKVYDHQKKLGPDPKPLSLKVLQQLLRWKVQHILELDGSSSGKIDLPREKQTASLNDKATQDLERVTNILQGKIEVESEADVDEAWTEEDGDSIKEFWFSLLKDRHAELQDREEQSNQGKGLRQRKRVQYSEEALAQAASSVPEDEESRRKRRRSQLGESSSISITQDKATQSFLQPPSSTSKQAEICNDKEGIQGNGLSSTFLHEVRGAARSEAEVSLTASEPAGSDGVGEQHIQEGEYLRMEQNSSKATINPIAKKVKREEHTKHTPAEGIKGNKHPKLGAAGSVSATTSQVDTGKRLRIEQKQQLLKMEPELSRIADILQVKETVSGYSQQLLSHVMNNFRMPKEPRELVVMVEISLCLIASERFGEVLKHSPAVSRVGEEMDLKLKNEDFGSVFRRLQSMCKTCEVLPSAQQGASHKEISVNNAVDADISSQPTSAGIETPVELPPTSQGFDLSPITKCNLHPPCGQQACSHQNDSSQNCAVSVGTQDMVSLAQDDLPRTELEQSGQPAQAGSCEVTRFQDTDPTLQAQGTGETDNPEAASGDNQSQRQPMAVSPEIIHPPLLRTVGETRARLKSDRDQLLHSWLAKQKLEVQDFMASCAQEKAARQKSFDKQGAKILASNVNMEKRAEMLRQLGDVFTCTRKLCEREEDDRRQVMNSTQRDIRDRINALYTNLQQQVTTGTLPDLLSEAKTMGLTFSEQSQTPKFSKHGPTHSKQGHQKAVSQVDQVAQVPPSLPGQNIDISLPPSTHTTQVQAHPQIHTQPQTRECTPIPPSNSQTRFQATFDALLQEAGARRRRKAVGEVHHKPDSSQTIPVCRPLSQAMPIQTTPSLDQELSTPEEHVAAQPPCWHPLTRTSQSHSLQQNTQTNERSQPSRSPLNVLESLQSSVESEPSSAISTQALERAYSVVEQGSVQPSLTEQVRVPESINPSTTRQPPVSQTSQTPTNLQSRGSQTGQFATNLQSRVTQIVDTSILQARISQSVQASPNLLPRVPHTVVTSPPQVSQTADAPTSLQSRASQIRRPVSIQHGARHPTSLYHSAASQVRLQAQSQPTGQSVSGPSLPSQTRSNVHSHNIHLGAHPSQFVFGPDPLAHEENRLKREHEKEKLLYNEETTQIKTEYDREATELRRKYEGLLYERARKFEQNTTALKENLEKVDRNRQLAEALKLRSLLDQQKARQSPGHSTEVVSGSVQAGRLSGLVAGRGHLLPSHQSNVVYNFGRNIGRGGAAVSTGSEHLSVTDTGIPNSTTQVVNRGSHVTSWQSSRPSNNRHLPAAGFTSGGLLSSALPNCVPASQESFSSEGFVSFPESFPTTPSLSSSSGPFSAVSERVLYEPQSTISSPMQQDRPWISFPLVTENVIVPSCNAPGEHMSSHPTNSELVRVSSTSAAPAISITTAVSTPIVTEAVVVSVSPVLSPVREHSTNTDLAGNEFMQGGHSSLGSGPHFADKVNDLLVPLPDENQVNSTVEKMVRSEALAEAELGGLGAPSLGRNGLASSQPSTNELNYIPQSPQIPVIYLSDDD